LPADIVFRTLAVTRSLILQSVPAPRAWDDVRTTAAADQASSQLRALTPTLVNFATLVLTDGREAVAVTSAS
jgi:hypothetical protein